MTAYLGVSVIDAAGATGAGGATVTATGAGAHTAVELTFVAWLSDGAAATVGLGRGATLLGLLPHTGVAAKLYATTRELYGSYRNREAPTRLMHALRDGEKTAAVATAATDKAEAASIIYFFDVLL